MRILTLLNVLNVSENIVLYESYKKVLRAFNLYKENSNFSYEEYQPTNANNHIQLRWQDTQMPRTVHYEFLFEKNNGGYSVELHAEKSGIMLEMCGEFAKINFNIRKIKNRDLVFYRRHRADDFGAALKIPYGTTVLPKLMAEDMRELIKKTRLLVEEAVRRAKAE